MKAAIGDISPKLDQACLPRSRLAHLNYYPLLVQSHDRLYRHTPYRRHALFTDTQLAAKFNTAEAILQDPAMQKFIRWVETKPNAFYERVTKSERVRNR